MSPLPKFCVDGEHRAALVAGRAAELGPISGAQIERCVEIAATHAARTGLPLTFVIAAAPGQDESYAGAAAGLLVASARQNGPATVDKEALARHRSQDVPATFWQALAEAGAHFSESDPESDDPEFPREGLFLVPGGWSMATLYLGKRPSPEELAAVADAGEEAPESSAERVHGCAAEDTMAATVVPPELLARVRASSEPLVLEADYC